MVSSEKSPLQSDDLLIIQCPECFTRFTVNTELVARAAAPRFHCSRCDHVFPIQEAGTQSSIETEEHREPPHTETQQTAAEYDSPDLTQPATPDVPQPSIESPQADMEHNEHEADANLAEDLDHTSDHTQAGEPALDQIQEDLFSPPSWEQSDAPHGSVETSDSPLNVPSEGTLSTSEIEPDREEETKEELFSEEPEPFPPDNTSVQTEFDFDADSEIHKVATAEEVMSGEGPRGANAAKELLAHASHSETSTDQESAKDGQTFGYPPPSNLISGADSVTSLQGGHWRGLFVCCSPLAIGLLVIALSSYIITNAPSIGKSVFPLIALDAPELAPSDLFIDGTLFKRVELDNGQRVQLVSGTLVNDSDTDFHDIRIQALAFDTKGELTTQATVSASSTLAKTRIKTLTLRMIEQLQEEAVAGSFVLRGGDTHDFVVALPDAEVNEAESLSVRIYSVRPAS